MKNNNINLSNTSGISGNNHNYGGFVKLSAKKLESDEGKCCASF